MSLKALCRCLFACLVARAATEDGCPKRGRVLIAVGAHTDDSRIQDEVDRIVAAAASMRCPSHYEVALFVDGAKEYKRLRHEPMVRVAMGKLLANGTAAFKAFVSHQLLMASLPSMLAEDTSYESVWVVEEDARFSGDWTDLLELGGDDDLVAYVRKTNRGMAALLPIARISTRLFKAVHSELQLIDERDHGVANATTTRKTIHGAFVYQLCAKSRWCTVKRLAPEWLGIYRAKCPWSTQMYDAVSPSFFKQNDTHGRIFHPVKVDPVFHGRDFARFKCKKQFYEEGVPAGFLKNRLKNQR